MDYFKPFAIATKEMEGDGSTGALALPKYYVLKQNVVHKKNECHQSHPLFPMFAKMISKLDDYLEEALCCDSLVLATLLHPAFRLAVFEEFFPEKKEEAEKLLLKTFQERKRHISKKTKEPETSNVNLEKKSGRSSTQIFNLFHPSSTKAENDELTVYLKGGEVFEMDPNDTKSGLLWWKVCFTFDSTRIFNILLN